MGVVFSIPPTLAQILAKFTGTPDGTKFLRDDGSWQAISGASLSTLTAGTLSASVPLNLGTNAIVFNGIGSVPASTVSYIVGDAANGNVIHNVAIGKTITGKVAAVTYLSLAGTSNTIGDVASGGHFYSDSNTSRIKNASATQFQAYTTDAYIDRSGALYIRTSAGTNKYKLADALMECDRISLGGTIGSSVDPGAGGLSLTNRLQFSGAGTASTSFSLIYADAAAGNMFLTVPTGKYQIHSAAGGNILGLGLSNGNVGSTLWFLGPFGSNAVDYTKAGIYGDGTNIFSNAGTAGFQLLYAAQSPILGVGIANGSVGANAWALGPCASSGAADATKAGIYATGATLISSNVATGGSWRLNVNNVEKYRLAAALFEADRAAFGGTIGSSIDPGAGGISAVGNIVVGTAANATTATGPFIYEASCAGTPTGVPTAFTGRVPTVIDTTAGKLWAYYGDAWHYVTFT